VTPLIKRITNEPPIAFRAVNTPIRGSCRKYLKSKRSGQQLDCRLFHTVPLLWFCNPSYHARCIRNYMIMKDLLRCILLSNTWRIQSR
jgi:hypothetical protein